MDIRQQTWFLWFETALAWLVLAILVYFTFLDIVQAPYLGFSFSNGKIGEIYEVSAPNPNENAPLLTGKTLVKVGEINYVERNRQLIKPLFPPLTAGDVVTLVVEEKTGESEQGELKSIDWVVPGFNWTEFWTRIQNTWPMGYLFWFAGLATILLVRPFDTKRSLFIAFFFLTALWLVIGNTSRWGHGDSRLLYRVALMLSVPVLLHLHWIFPRPLGKIPLWLGGSIYAISIGIALLHWTPYISPEIALLAFALALFASLVLLVLHAWRQPETRAQVGLLLVALSMATLPTIAISLSMVSGGLFNANLIYGLASLPLVPGAYFYSIYRFQLGGNEFRANRLIAVYLYILLLSAIVGLMTYAISAYTTLDDSPVMLALILGIFTALLSIYGFPYFQRFVERRLLAMPLPPVELIDIYLTRITTTLSEERLIHLLKNEVLPTLLVRESALLRVRDNDLATLYSSHPTLAPPPPAKILIAPSTLQPGVLYDDAHETQSSEFSSNGSGAAHHIHAQESDAQQINGGDAGNHEPLSPSESISSFTASDFATLHDHFKRETVYLANQKDAVPAPSWVKVGLAVQMEDNLLGFWLLGRRDPDDIYTFAEVNTLQTLARQTALALANIDQAAQLQALYQASIERREQERIKMAHFLHDDVLNQAVDLYNRIPDFNPEIEEAYTKLKEHIRRMITDLRPPSLNFGLGVAIEELANELIDREQAQIVFDLTVEPQTLQYPPQIETHIYRIVQQACENALRHSRASTIKITGKLTPELTDITVEDDGVGFALEKPLNLAHLLADKHFGLVHMLERAGHIYAKLTLESTPGQGTKVHLYWVNKLGNAGNGSNGGGATTMTELLSY